MIPVVAEGGSTILVFIPGYADLVRMHSWLYWNLPTAGSVNMGYVPPKPEQLTEDDEEEEQDFHGLGWYWLVCMPLKQVYLYRIIQIEMYLNYCTLYYIEFNISYSYMQFDF